MDTKSDFSCRIGRTGSMILTNGPEYICNIAQRMFYMVPGTDKWNKNMGLDITTRAKRPYQNGERDSDYEQEILKQFIEYTDIIPSAVVAMYQDKLLIITMLAKYNGEEFTLRVSSDPNKLATQILPKVVEPIHY